MIASNITIDTTQLEYDLDVMRLEVYDPWARDSDWLAGWEECTQYVIALLEGRG